METTATATTTTVVAKPKKGPSTLLIGVLIVLMIGLGLGVYFKLKSKKDDPKDPTTTDTEDEDPSASGRIVTNHKFPLTPAQIAVLLATQAKGPNPGELGESPTNPIYYKNPIFLEAIEKEAVAMQKRTSSGEIDVVRATYSIGEAMMGRDSEEQECIEYLFNKLPNVDFTETPDRKYLAFPIYGTNEIKGAVYRAELQAIINIGWQGHNLTRLRHNNHSGWCYEIGLNLLVGTTVSNTPSTNLVRMSWAPRSELDFYKKFNRCWVHDGHLADTYVNKQNSNQIVLSATHPDARSAYCATGMFEFVQRWIREIDRLDEVTRIAAEKRLTNSPTNPTGTWYTTTVNPETGVDENQKQG
jgi:hypothetical protein